MTDELADHISRLPPLGEDDAAYVVFADWLQARGDSWGELIMLQHRGLQDLADTFVRVHGNELLGDIYRNPKHELAWHLGFLRRATLRTAAEKPAVLDAVRALAKLPCAARLDELVLDPRPETFATTRDWQQSRRNIEDPWPDWDDLGPPLLRKLAARKLAFGAWPAMPEQAYVKMPSLDMIARWFHKAGLQSLRVTGNWAHDRSEVLNLDDLRELALYFAHGNDRSLEIVAASELPALERLTLGLGGSAHCVLDTLYSPDDDGYPDTYTAEDLVNLDITGIASPGISAEVLQRFLDKLPPALTDLGFTSSILDEAFIEILAAHPRTSRLRRLDFTGCVMTISTQTVLGEAGLPNVVFGRQHGDPDFFMRYVATME
jgi:uncharacterized protein (TIGR02996 family)